MKLKQKSSWITYREMLDQVTNNSIKSWLIENGPITKRISANEDFELNLIRDEIDKVDLGLMKDLLQPRYPIEDDILIERQEDNEPSRMYFGFEINDQTEEE